MDKIYQTEWHGIPFSSFSNCKSNKLADSEFYNHFYQELFRKYSKWEDLSSAFIQSRRGVAKFLEGRIPRQGAVLSVGCGLALIEKFLLEFGVGNLDIHEITEAPLSWAREIFPPDSMFVGLLPECLNPEVKYDLIYLVTVEYCFDDSDFLSLLKGLKGRLNSGGRCLVLSLNPQRSGVNFWELVWSIKSYAKEALSVFGFRDLGQFLGWRRTSEEIRERMDKAGFLEFQDGFFKTTDTDWYWVEGTSL